MTRIVTIAVVTVIAITCLVAVYPKHSWRPMARTFYSAIHGGYKNLKTSSTKVFQSAKQAEIGQYGAKMASVLRQRGVVMFLGGTIFFLLVVRMFVGFKALSFISTLEHELVHGMVAVICGGSFNEMKVTADKGGYAQVTGNNFLINIAPYCLPFFCISVLCLIPFLQHTAKLVGIVIAGLAYGSYLRGNFPSIGKQPDIKNSGGKLVAYPVILGSNATLLAGIVVTLAKWGR